MHRITTTVPPTYAAVLRALAEREGLTVADIVAGMVTSSCDMWGADEVMRQRRRVA